MRDSVAGVQQPNTCSRLRHQRGCPRPVREYVAMPELHFGLRGEGRNARSRAALRSVRRIRILLHLCVRVLLRWRRRDTLHHSNALNSQASCAKDRNALWKCRCDLSRRNRVVSRGCDPGECPLAWSRSQGFGCSPIKAVRELGSERRETVRSLSVVGAGYLKGVDHSTRGPG